MANIIDGIDVSKCEFLKEGICYAYKDNEGYSDIECKYEENSNCYYKQLKRAEQENERLKSIVESNKQEVEQAELLVMDNDRLQQEVEKLKDIIYYDVEKYKQALIDIREICNKRHYFVKRFPNSEYSDGVENSKLAVDILDKINEVIGVEE